MPALLQKLKERKLVQWALAYLAGAFVVVQLMDALAEPLGMGVLAQRGVLVALGLGLFVTLTLAWYHGEQGRQRVSGAELLILAALLAIAGGLLELLWRSGRQLAVEAEPEAATAALAEPLGPASVAVLPLEGFSAGEGEAAEFLAEGLHTEILTQLTKIGALEVIGATSVARYAATDKTTQQIGRELGVAAVLQGSLMRAADRVRLNVQLTEAKTGRQLWAEAYDRAFSMPQLFQLLEDVATDIAAALQVALTPQELERIAEPPTASEEAFEHYVRGEAARARGVNEEAMAAYERAVALDPGFAAAWARLAEVRSWICYMRCVFEPDWIERAAQALDRARALAPEAVETREALGAYYRSVELDYERAAREFERILELRPNDAEAIYQLGRTRARQGRWEEAERWLRRALALDPLHSKSAEYLGNVLRNTSRFAEAARFLDRAAALAPDDGPTATVRMWIYLWGLGDTATVREFVERGPPSQVVARHLWRAELAYLRRDAEALERLARDSLWADQPGARYNALTQVALLRNEPETRAIYADSLAAFWSIWLERALDMPTVGYRDLAIAWNRSFLGVALALSGEEERAIREGELAADLWLGEALDRDRVFLNLALIYTFLGHSETAIDRIERELSLGSPQITPIRLRLDPDFDSLRDHPRFQELLERHGSTP